MFDRVGARGQREADAVGTMRVDRDLFPEQRGGFDDRLCFVVEHLLAQPRADAAVNPTRRGKFDHIGAAPDLEPHRAAAIVGAVAGVARAREEGPELVAIAERAIHMPRAARNTVARIDDARPLHLARRDRVAQRQGRAVAIAEVADGGEARAQRLHAVDLRIKALRRGAEGDFFELPRDAARVAGQVDMTVDQAGQDIFVLEVDQRRTGFGGLIAVGDADDPAVLDNDRRCAARRLSGLRRAIARRESRCARAPARRAAPSVRR